MKNEEIHTIWNNFINDINNENFRINKLNQTNNL